MKHYIAIDWGATSGRVIVAHVENGDTRLEEVHRFAHRIHEAADGHWYWDFTGLLKESMEGLRKAAKLGHHYESIGVDTWGVDVVFYDEAGQMLAEPLAYRDPFTTEVPERFFKHLSKESLYEKTGIQLMHFNTVFKLYACHEEGYRPFLEAKHILFLPDAVGYYLTGRMVCEYTDLSTSAMMNPRTKELDADILSLCGLSREQFPEVVYPGHDLGLLKPEILAATGLNADCRVTVVAGHDTGSAVAACPRKRLVGSDLPCGKEMKLAFLSSGTWSLMGIVTDEPIINEQTAALNFTNEGGVAGTTRVLKNITGMWILEQCRKEWKAQYKDYSHPQLIRMAQSIDHSASAPSSASAPHQATSLPHQLFNPDEPRFANPESMLSEVCGGSQLTDAEVAWVIYHSLANRYGEVFRMLQSISPFHIDGLYVIGGGVQNTYLLALTEEAIGVPVVAGTTEATALGNIKIQSHE